MSNEIICPECGTKNTNKDKFCGSCGHTLQAAKVEGTSTIPNEVSCPNCGQFLKINDKFCGSCGHTLKGEKVVTSTLGQAPTDDGFVKFAFIGGTVGCAVHALWVLIMAFMVKNFTSGLLQANSYITNYSILLMVIG